MIQHTRVIKQWKGHEFFVEIQRISTLKEKYWTGLQDTVTHMKLTVHVSSVEDE